MNSDNYDYGCMMCSEEDAKVCKRWCARRNWSKEDWRKFYAKLDLLSGAVLVLAVVFLCFFLFFGNG